VFPPSPHSVKVSSFEPVVVPPGLCDCTYHVGVRPALVALTCSAPSALPGPCTLSSNGTCAWDKSVIFLKLTVVMLDDPSGGGQWSMPECIVCKGYYEAGQPCRRCGSDNSAWESWRATQDEEKGGAEGLLAFYEPYLYLPFLITGLALVFGPIGMLWAWKGILSGARLLAVVITVCSCPIAALVAYGARHDIREQALLQRVRRGYSVLLRSVRLRVIVVPVFLLLLVSLTTYITIKSDTLWKFARWLLLDPEYLEQVEQQEAVSDTTSEEEQTDEDGEEEEGLRKRVRQVLPFALMGFYVTSMISFTYSASLLQALSYADKMNQQVPQPIFLREDMLVGVVQREAGRAVYRAITPKATGGAQTPTTTKQMPRSWIWDEMERTDNGGVWLKAIVKAGTRMEEGLTGKRTERPVYITYVVEADPWSRITKVARVKEPEGKKR